MIVFFLLGIDINYAKKLGYKIKLLGYAELIGKNIFQRVHPTLIKNSSYVGSIDGVLNAVIIDGIPVGQSVIQGEGAGPAATTSALISDISSILRGNIKFPFSILPDNSLFPLALFLKRPPKRRWPIFCQAFNSILISLH